MLTDGGILAYWPHLAGAATLAAILATAVHILLYKDDTRAAAG